MNNLNQSSNKIFIVNCNNLDDVFSQWVELLSHKVGRATMALPNLSKRQKDELKNGLTPKRRKVLVEILKERYLLSFKIKDEKLLDEYALSMDVKKRIKDRCNMSSANFNGLMGLFRSIKILQTIDGVDKINPAFIPDLSQGRFTIAFDFNISKEDLESWRHSQEI